jgi:hypothetical protein
MSDPEPIVCQIAADFYFSQPNSSRSGAKVFVADMLQLLRTPGLGARVKEATAACEADYPVLEPNLLQENLFAALFDDTMRSARPHPRLEDMAAARADTIVAEFTTERIDAALRHTTQYARISEHHWEVERAREREAEIARNRRRAPRKALYPC